MNRGVIYKKRNLVTFFILIILAIAFFAYARLYKDTATLNISTKNISNIEIKYEDQTKARFTDSEKSLRLKKKEYTLLYSGQGDYASGEIKINLDKNTSFSIDPKYSDKKLQSIAASEQQNIMRDLVAQINIKGLYTVNKGEVYELGEWYGTTLSYNGEDYYNADSLRLVMKKENDKWVLMTPIPSLILTKNQNPNIPEDVLEKTNNQEAPINPRYTATD